MNGGRYGPAPSGIARKISWMSGSGTSGPDFNKSGPAAGKIAGETGAEKSGLCQFDADAIKSHGPTERAGPAAAVFDAGADMILQVLPDARERRSYVNRVSAQFGRIANARKHQELRRVDDAAGEQHFALCLHDAALAIAQILNSDGAAAIKDECGWQEY